MSFSCLDRFDCHQSSSPFNYCYILSRLFLSEFICFILFYFFFTDYYKTFGLYKSIKSNSPFGHIHLSTLTYSCTYSNLNLSFIVFIVVILSFFNFFSNTPTHKLSPYSFLSWVHFFSVFFLIFFYIHVI